jgi:hypothetical protein
MADPTKIKRGPVVEVREREYSGPIPDSMLPRFEAAGLVVDDNDHDVTLYRAGFGHAAVWGPAVEGHWFARYRSAEAVRVAGRDEALTYLLDQFAAEVTA